MKKIKVVIFDGYGASGFPEHIQKQIKEQRFPECRCGSIIEILEKYPSEPRENLAEKHKKLRFDEVLRCEDKFYFGVKPYNISCTIVEVDTSKKWTLSEYDGAEYIKYLDYKCISEELNYWK